MSTYVQDPDAELDYVEGYTPPEGDSVVSATWTVPAGLTQPQPPTLTGNKATVWLGGGTVGQSYDVTVHFVTAQGREDDRTFSVAIRQR